MKYAALTLLALALCIAGGWAAAHVINTQKELRLRYRVIIAAAVSTALAAVSSFNYLEAYYHADDTAAEYMKSSDLVAVEASESGQAYFFDGPGSGQAVIFYPGAKVDETAYAPLMFRLAEQGTDCFLRDILPPPRIFS